jgi:exodeoxyribonuclease-5
MAWSPQQENAIRAVKAWMADSNAPQVFRLFGFAGTGKTTLAKYLAEESNGTVLFAAYTGKAALMLRKKGCVGASTIHSLIYKVRQDEITGRLSFRWNADSDAGWASLIVIDEVSMVDPDMGHDLLRYGKKVLVLGDPAQLPPVEGDGFFLNAKPDIMLTEVHRQAAENPIIRMSIDVREGKRLVPGMYGESEVIARADISTPALQAKVLAADQVLCGLNRTRHGLNRRIRELRGFVGEPQVWMPTPGERLVCLRNNREKNLLNGGMWESQTVSKDRYCVSLRVQSLDDPEMSPVDVNVLPEFFQGTDDQLDWKKKIGWDEFTFGWALSVHKAQGSQWDNVLIYDESQVFRENARKHLYTGLTRAAERVTVLVE